MVKKEMDAGIIQKLHENHIAFLPYVSDAKLRKTLRVDIQALQTLEWNSNNYETMLPRVVAEIWHSFSDRQIVMATNAEKTRRLAAELDLERLKNSGTIGVFSEQEEAEFKYIWDQIDRYEPIKVRDIRRSPNSKEEVVGVYRFRVHLQYLVSNLDNIMGSEYEDMMVRSFLSGPISELLPSRQEKLIVRQLPQISSLRNELRMYGLVQLSQKTKSPSSLGSKTASYSVYCSVFSEKMSRFKYWLAYNGKLPDQLILECVEEPKC